MPAFEYNANVPNISQNEKRWAESHGLASEYWDIDMLRAQFRFKRPEFRRLMSAMHLSDKFILLSRQGRAQYFPTDICMTILLRRVEYSSRFVDILIIFRLPSNRICDIFHVSCIWISSKPWGSDAEIPKNSMRQQTFWWMSAQLRQSVYWGTAISPEEFIKMAGWQCQCRQRSSGYHASDAAPAL